MNFSFSDVKTSIDKSAGAANGLKSGFLDRYMMVLYTEAAHHPLERVLQESDEDEDHITSKKPFIYTRSNRKPKSKQSPKLHGEDDENVKADNSDDEYETSQIMPSLTERC